MTLTDGSLTHHLHQLVISVHPQISILACNIMRTALLCEQAKVAFLELKKEIRKDVLNVSVDVKRSIENRIACLGVLSLLASSIKYRYVCIIVLYCIVLYCIVLYCIVLVSHILIFYFISHPRSCFRQDTSDAFISSYPQLSNLLDHLDGAAGVLPYLTNICADAQCSLFLSGSPFSDKIYPLLITSLTNPTKCV